MLDNDEDDTVSFDMKNTFIFRPDLTKGLTGNEIVTIPHLFIMVSCKSFCHKFSQNKFASSQKKSSDECKLVLHALTQLCLKYSQ